MSAAELRAPSPDDLALVDKLADPKYFIETFFWIIDKNRKRVPFLLNPPQDKYLANRTHADLILKARKEGMSSLIRALWLHACFFFENTRAVVLSHEMDATMRHFENVRWTLENMGYEGFKFVVDLDKENQKQLAFPQTNSSFWIGTAGARAFGRGDDITHLHMSEVAHYQDQTILTSVMEACVPGAYKVMETTAKGVGEAFHRLWKEAGDPNEPSPWRRHFFAWWQDPTNQLDVPAGVTLRLNTHEARMKRVYDLNDRQLYWYRTKYALMANKAEMPQEYPSNDQEAFLSSGRHAFSLERLADKKERTAHLLPVNIGELDDDGANVRVRTNTSEGRLRVWKMPRHNRSYLISADVGEGVPGGDFSVAHVMDRSSWEIVAVWRGRIDPGDFGRELVKLAYFYGNAVLIPELNNHGWATVEAIKSEGYEHLLNTKEIWKEGETPKDGFPQNERTRALIITALRNSIDDDTSFCPDPVTLEECETFVQNERSKKFEAQAGGHDDCVISWAIAVFCVKFLTVDETYADRAVRYDQKPIVVTSAVGQPGKRSSTGYR